MGKVDYVIEGGIATVTLMFANIVRSPDPAAELGDQRWLDQHESFFTATRYEWGFTRVSVRCVAIASEASR